MQKKKVFKIEDSNIEGIGTDADKQCRETAAATEKAWKKVKKDKPGKYCWRIEKFKVKTNRDGLEGKFFDDDSYIYLSGVKNKDNDKKIDWDVHFWLGKTTSQDESGTAAYKTVELDDFMGGDPIQHRECSGHESRLFLSYWPEGIRLLSGGCESGFNIVKPETFTPRLLWIKGKKNVRVVQVDIKVSNLNAGDVFILDCGLNLYQYQGKKCGSQEKLQAGKLQRMIDDERKGKPEVLVFSQTEEPGEDCQIFFSYFQEDVDEIKEGEKVPVEECQKLLDSIDGDGGDDAQYEKKSDKSLHQLSDSSGEMKFTEVAKGDHLEYGLLKSDDVFIFNNGCEIYVWVGKDASSDERKKGMGYASKYLKDNGLPPQMPVTKVHDGQESERFLLSLKGKKH